MEAGSPTVAAVHASDDHHLWKATRPAIRLVAGLGVEGDAHRGATVQHRSRVARDPTQPNLRQVHLIHGELHDELRLAGFDVGPGQMGENITTRGLAVLDLPVGTRLHLGDLDDGLAPGLMAAVLDRDDLGTLVRKAGIMAVVASGGVVAPGDPITVELPAGPPEPLGPV